MPERIVFLHIPKTAGTTVIQLLREHLGAAAVMSHGDFMACSLDAPLPRETVERYRVVSGHFGFVNIAPWLEGSYAFTFLREPLERIRSLYQFARKPAMGKLSPLGTLAAEVDFETFLRSDLPQVQNLLDNAQTWQLLHSQLFQHVTAPGLRAAPEDELFDRALAHLALFDRVGTTERFEQELPGLLADLGLEFPKSVPRVFASPATDDVASLPADLREALRARLSLDYRVYEAVSGEHPLV